MSVEGDRVYIGGHFLAMGGVYRNYIAAVDTISGGVTPWNPWADGEVTALAVHGDVVYAGGDFCSIGGQARSHLAALDASTGLATEWNPVIEPRPEEYASGPPLVRALAVGGDTVYVGGAYFVIGGQERQGLAAVDANTGAVLDWNPNPVGWWTFVYAAALALRDRNLYVGGYFETIGGQNRYCLAAVDVATGQATGWDPSPNNGVWTLAASDSVAYAGESRPKVRKN